MEREKCIECGKVSDKDEVCTNCGLVVIDRPVVGLLKRDYEKRGIDNLSEPLSPHIRFKNVHGKSSKNIELDRALKNFSKKMKKDQQWRYLLFYEDIKKKCSVLQIPDIVFKETLNIYKGIRDIDNSVLRSGLESCGIAFIKIACKLHSFNIIEDDLYELVENNHLIVKRVNKVYFMTLRLLKIRFNNNIPPSYIDYACNMLNMPELIYRIHKIYAQRKKYFKVSNKKEGYILGIIYLVLKNLKKKITYKILSDKFKISPITINSRVKEIRRMFE